ncbi:conserved hypothetical protein [Cupriavidus necator]|uniref:Uncharacterized protein n=2 Tax=Cupriavidus necator TaxID=106590 RepID=A0A1K0IY31_CUPNE|nr:conserved hypothetical protein [Cupriavidus necator]
MGRYQLNVEVFCDHATPEKASAFRMHMDLPFPKEDFEKLHAMLNRDQWKEFSDYFSQRYPEHKGLIEIWCAGSAERSCGRKLYRLDRHAALAA